MKRIDVQKMLEENGFKFIRQNKHPIFSDGLSNIVFPCSSGEINHGLVHQIRSEIRKAVAKREEIKFVKNFKSSDPAELAEKYLYLAELEKPVPEKEMKVAKFKEKDRRPIDEMIKTLYSDGVSYKKIAKALEEEGFTSPLGEKINEKFVSNSIYRLGLARSKQALTVPKNRNWAPVEIAIPPPPPPPTQTTLIPQISTPEPPPVLTPPPHRHAKIERPPRPPNVREEALALAEMIMGINWLDTADKLNMLEILNRKAQRSLK